MIEPWSERPALEDERSSKNTDMTNFRSQLSRQNQNNAQKKYNMELERHKISKN